MATSGTLNIPVASWISLKFTWAQTSQSIENNTTTISWQLDCTTTSAGALYKKNRTWTVTIDGTKYTGTVNISLDTSSTQTFAKGTATIKHNSDGKKTFAYSVTQQFELTLNSGKYLSTYSGNGSDTLTTIPRKSSVAVPDGTLNTRQTITVTQKLSTFTHSIKAVCGNSTLYIKADGTTSTTEVKHNDNSIPWTPPIDWASQAPQGQSVSVTFTITTYNGSTAIGTDTDTATYAIPDNIIAPLSFTISDPTGLADYYGNYIQGKSKITITMTTYGSYGAWIKSHKVTVDGKTYNNGTVNGNTITITTDVINGSGSLSIVATVTDSRNRSTTAKGTANVLKYDVPSITSLSAYRSDASGNTSSKGEYITVKFSSDVYSLNNKNDALYSVIYKKASETEETKVPLNDYAGIYSVTDGKYTFRADSSSYSIWLNVKDRFVTTPQLTVGPSLEKVWSLLKGGGKIVGAALGKLAEISGVFDIAFQTKFSGGIFHPVLPTNSDLDAELTPKTYILLSDNTYINSPESGVGLFLEIVGSKDDIIMQRASVFSKGEPRTYERNHYYGGWGEWICTSGDFVVEQGESDGWNYEKWNSGLAKCRKTVAVSTAISTAWGTMYVGNTKMSRQSYPLVFTAKPKEVASITTGSNAVWLFAESGGNGVNGAYQSAIYNICRPSSVTASATYYITIDVIGKWK